jgi:ribosomal protein S18 acetylase RimI-like enzyme
VSAPLVRSSLRPGDLGAIVAHHGRLYGAEFGVDARFEALVADAVAKVAKRGFPGARGQIRIVELDGEHAGSIALTDEGDGSAAIRWFVLDPTLRGAGLGSRLLDELLEVAHKAGFERVWLETFSELEAAAHLYRERGFELLWEETAPRWGRERITYQHYELELGASSTPRRGAGGARGQVGPEARAR